MAEPAKLNWDCKSFMVPNTVVEAGLGPVPVAILCYLYRCALGASSAFPSTEKIANGIGCSVKTVQRHLKELGAAGIIQKTVRRHGGRQTSNLYTLPEHVSPRASDCRPGDSVSEQGDNLSPPGASDCRPKDVKEEEHTRGQTESPDTVPDEPSRVCDASPSQRSAPDGASRKELDRLWGEFLTLLKGKAKLLQIRNPGGFVNRMKSQHEHPDDLGYEWWLNRKQAPEAAGSTNRHPCMDEPMGYGRGISDAQRAYHKRNCRGCHKCRPGGIYYRKEDDEQPNPADDDPGQDRPEGARTADQAD